VAINVKTGMPPFGILANHKIKMCHNSMKKNNDTKDYSERLEFLNSEPQYASKKIVNQSSDFPVRRTGSYRHKKALLTAVNYIDISFMFRTLLVSANSVYFLKYDN